MKRDARRLSKDVLDSKFGDCSVTARIVSLICEADNMGAVDGPLDLIENEMECNESGKVILCIYLQPFFWKI